VGCLGAMLGVEGDGRRDWFAGVGRDCRRNLWGRSCRRRDGSLGRFGRVGFGCFLLGGGSLVVRGWGGRITRDGRMGLGCAGCWLAGRD